MPRAVNQMNTVTCSALIRTDEICQKLWFFLNLNQKLLEIDHTDISLLAWNITSEITTFDTCRDGALIP